VGEWCREGGEILCGTITNAIKARNTDQGEGEAGRKGGRLGGVGRRLGRGRRGGRGGLLQMTPD